MWDGLYQAQQVNTFNGRQQASFNAEAHLNFEFTLSFIFDRYCNQMQSIGGELITIR